MPYNDQGEATPSGAYPAPVQIRRRGTITKIDFSSLRKSTDPLTEESEKLPRRDSIRSRVEHEDFPELQEINFMTTEKSVRVRRTIEQTSINVSNDGNFTTHSKFIKVSNGNAKKRLKLKARADENALAIKYVLEKKNAPGEDQSSSNYGSLWVPNKNTHKLPASFLKMKLQQQHKSEMRSKTLDNSPCLLYKKTRNIKQRQVFS